MTGARLTDRTVETREGPLPRGSEWEALVAADRPVLIEAITDPEFPPLPPHIELDQAIGMGKALLGGDENAGRIIRQALKGKLAEFTNR